MSLKSTASFIVTRLRDVQKSWHEVASKLTDYVSNDEDYHELAIAIGEGIKSNSYAMERPTLKDLMDAVVSSGLNKADSKEFISTLITSADFEDYSPALYSRHLGRHFKKEDTGAGAPKKALLEVILTQLGNISSDERAKVIEECSRLGVESKA